MSPGLIAGAGLGISPDHDPISAVVSSGRSRVLVVVHADTIVHEEYRRGNDAQSRATSWSVAKSLASASVGIAIEDGHLDGLDDQIVVHLPELAGSGYDGVTVRELLTMSSGVDFDEGYDSTFADINMIFLRSMALSDRCSTTTPTSSGSVSQVPTTTTSAPTPASWPQRSPQRRANQWPSTYRSSSGNRLAWRVTRSGAPIAPTRRSGSAASTPNYGTTPASDGSTCRAGRGTAARSSQQPGSKPRHTPEAAHLEPGENPDSSWTFGYGYNWWIPEDRVNGEFTTIGVWGQYIYVDPVNHVVIARSSIDGDFDDHDHETVAAFRAIADEVTR